MDAPMFIHDEPMIHNSDEEYEPYENTSLSYSDKLYLGACSVLFVALLFMASTKIR